MHDGGLAGRGQHRTAVLERAVMGEDDVQQRTRQLPGKALDALGLPANQVIAERNLAQQLAVVGEVDRGGVQPVGLDLADVVDQRAGDGQIPVDAPE